MDAQSSNFDPWFFQSEFPAPRVVYQENFYDGLEFVGGATAPLPLPPNATDD